MRSSNKLLVAAALAATLLFVESDRALAASIGINGTTLIFTGDNGNDVFSAASNATQVTIQSSTPVTILTPDCAPSGGGVQCGLGGIDLLAILAEGGDDVIDASSVSSNLNVFLSGGTGEDVLLGGFGNDILKGGPGDDVMLGGPGTNVCFGGGGGDIFLQCTVGEVEPPDPTLAPTAVPEPGTLVLLASALAACAAKRRHRKA